MEKESVASIRCSKKEAIITERQREYAELYRMHGTISAVARELGVGEKSVQESLSRARRLNKCKTLAELIDLIDGKYVSRTTRAKQGTERATTSELLALIKRQEYRCALSGIALDPSSSALDHIHPVSKGGGDSVDNLQWLDKRVNRMKGTMSKEKFIELCKKIAAWNS